MRREYHFDYRKSRPNRFADLMKAGMVAVVLRSGQRGPVSSAGLAFFVLLSFLRQ